LAFDFMMLGFEAIIDLPSLHYAAGQADSVRVYLWESDPQLSRLLRTSAQTTGAPTARVYCDEPTGTAFYRHGKGARFGFA
jgi:hypothetical protein